MAVGKPIFIVRPGLGYCNNIGWIPYYYLDELKEKGLK